MSNTWGKYKGWNVSTAKNSWLTLYIAPQLGGRIIQLEMDKYEFFFTNPLLEGTEPDKTRLGKNGTWLNYGGEKIWPAPQGWNSPDQWPGPPDQVLDSGEYSIVETTDNEGTRSVTLTSPFDERTGLQIVKNIHLSENASEVIVKASFFNNSNITRQWSIWPVIQMNTSGTRFENQYQVVCPVNPNSKFPGGYQVMHGLVNNPQYQLNTEGRLIVNYQYLVGKVGLDTTSDWIAFVDRKTGKIVVLKFQCPENESYPNDTNVQIWTAGQGVVYSRNVIRKHTNNRKLNPPYLELELLSPLQDIQPGKSIQFEYRIQACTIPEHSEISDVRKNGVIASSLQIDRKAKSCTISGKYGVFRGGIVKLRTKNTEGCITDLYSEKVSPLHGIELNIIVKNEIELIDRGDQLSVDFFDQEGCFIEAIDEI